jgi:hypothetical protein
MVDMAAIAGAASALKAAYDLSKAALSAHDAAVVRAKITEMQGEISSALASAITAQTDQMALLKRVDELEKNVADRKAWDREKRRYDLVQLPPGVWIRQLKESAAKPGEPVHPVCCNCYEQRKISPLQTSEKLGTHYLTCNGCGATLELETHRRPPLQLNYKDSRGWT